MRTALGFAVLLMGASIALAQCTSVLVVPVAGFGRATLLRTIRETQAKGATPIARSLERAVEHGTSWLPLECSLVCCVPRRHRRWPCPPRDRTP